jgi:Copper amine oxidase N-terminal domain
VILALTFATYAVTLNGQPVLPHARAAVIGGRVLLPVRALADALGAEIAYDAAARRIVVRRGARVTTLLAGGSVRVIGGRSYAGLRGVATAFGIGVTYAANTRTVALEDRSSEAVTYAAPLTPTPNPQPRLTVTTSPADGAHVHEPYPALSARFAGVSAIDPGSLHVRLDGRDVTADAAVVGDQVLYTPRTALAPGTHDVRVDAHAADGPAIGAAWSFDDTFAFVAPPPPRPYPISAIYLDRWVAPGTNAFDVVVRGAPGLTGFISVEGVSGIFPLTVYTYDAYVAHVVVPPGMYQPFAHVGARITLPDGTPQTIVLPQTIGLFTPRAGGDNKPVATPVPTPTRTGTPRYISAPAALPTPSAKPSTTPSPLPAVRPLPRVPRLKPRPSPTPA